MKKIILSAGSAFGSFYNWNGNTNAEKFVKCISVLKYLTAIGLVVYAFLQA
jgi:hypothetical protein